jgi:hypothetical protein
MEVSKRRMINSSFRIEAYLNRYLIGRASRDTSSRLAGIGGGREGLVFDGTGCVNCRGWKESRQQGQDQRKWQ